MGMGIPRANVSFAHRACFRLIHTYLLIHMYSFNASSMFMLSSAICFPCYLRQWWAVLVRSLSRTACDSEREPATIVNSWARHLALAFYPYAKTFSLVTSDDRIKIWVDVKAPVWPVCSYLTLFADFLDPPRSLASIGISQRNVCTGMRVYVYDTRDRRAIKRWGMKYVNNKVQ